MIRDRQQSRPTTPHRLALAGLWRTRTSERSAQSVNLQTVRNQILDPMSVDEFALLRPALERVTFECGNLVQQVDAPIEFVYFLEQGIVSLLARSATDPPVEIAMIDANGMVGIEVIFDASRAIYRAIVQAPNTVAMRIRVGAFREAIEQRPALLRHFARFSQSLMRQSAQNLLCNTSHALEQRLAKWLLLANEQFAGGLFR